MPSRIVSRRIVALALALAVAARVSAEETAAPASAAAEEKSGLVVTEHTIEVDGRELAYDATAGTMPLLEEAGKTKADIFFVAYTLHGALDPAQRPITFCFNGGPGSSSVWLHLGAFGPRRVEMGDAGDLRAPPWRLVENEATLLDATDLVFIDPVTTGYSRAAPGESDKQFHGVDEDVESVGEFIRLYATRFKRWASPKYLAGESYGTTRAAGLAGHLQDRHGMDLNGVILVSAILDFQTARSDRGNDLPAVLLLPTCTATAWYHRRLGADLQADLSRALREAETFALGEYASALLAGDALPEAEQREIAAKVARLTGLAPEFVEQANARISQRRFAKELLRDRRRTVGRLDSRFLGIDADAAGEGSEYDPSYAAIQGPFTATLNDYVRTRLGYESDLPYEILTGRVQPWSYDGYENRYLNVAERLRSAMTRNQALRVFVASGVYDFATPYFATRSTFDRLGLDPALRSHVTIREYEAGHMMYIHEPSRRALKEDLRAFYAGE
jgi:carboxypeptidase C (cathepsin A)